MVACKVAGPGYSNDCVGQVPRQSCRKVPEQKVEIFPKSPVTNISFKCRLEPVEECRQVPKQTCKSVPRQVCQDVAKQECRPVTR